MLFVGSIDINEIQGRPKQFEKLQRSVSAPKIEDSAGGATSEQSAGVDSTDDAGGGGGGHLFMPHHRDNLTSCSGTEDGFSSDVCYPKTGTVS